MRPRRSSTRRCNKWTVANRGLQLPMASSNKRWSTTLRKRMAQTSQMRLSRFRNAAKGVVRDLTRCTRPLATIPPVKLTADSRRTSTCRTSWRVKSRMMPPTTTRWMTLSTLIIVRDSPIGRNGRVVTRSTRRSRSGQPSAARAPKSAKPTTRTTKMTKRRMSPRWRVMTRG